MQPHALITSHPDRGVAGEILCSQGPRQIDSLDKIDISLATHITDDAPYKPPNLHSNAGKLSCGRRNEPGTAHELQAPAPPRHPPEWTGSARHGGGETTLSWCCTYNTGSQLVYAYVHTQAKVVCRPTTYLKPIGLSTYIRPAQSSHRRAVWDRLNKAENPVLLPAQLSLVNKQCFATGHWGPSTHCF